MQRPHITHLVLIEIALMFGSIASAAAAQQTPADSIPVSVVVTVKARHGKEAPEMKYKEDVRVFEGQQRLTVTDWVPLQGSHANLELLILIDEASGQSVANKLDDIRRFMNAQPPTTAIAIGYIENGSVRMAQNFTTEHDAAGKALRAPTGAGAVGASPFLSITNVLKRWRGSSSRHTIFLVSDGMDPLQRGISDTYLDDAIQIAQQTGTQIFAIYAARNALASRSIVLVNQGQSNLTRLSEESGGEVYVQGRYTPVSFAPSLDEFAALLAHQYLLTFLIPPQKKPTYRHVRLETEVPDAELVTADRVYVPAAQ